MTRINSIILAIAAMAVLQGCAQSLPLVSHAHVGHALTTWHDTPDQAGLYVSARHEALEALAIAAESADADDRDVQIAAINRIAYILNPDLSALSDPEFGTRYGVIRALKGALDHIEYAATSDDASLNLLNSINGLTHDGEQVINHFKLIYRRTQQGGDSAAILRQLNDELELAVNGRVDNGAVEVYGMRQFTADFNAMLAREDNPRYEPLPRKYVLGLVRLPNGHWGYRLNAGRSRYTDGGANSGGGNY